jgi:hypothetical protein
MTILSRLYCLISNSHPFYSELVGNNKKIPKLLKLLNYQHNRKASIPNHDDIQIRQNAAWDLLSILIKDEELNSKVTSMIIRDMISYLEKSWNWLDNSMEDIGDYKVREALLDILAYFGSKAISALPLLSKTVKKTKCSNKERALAVKALLKMGPEGKDQIEKLLKPIANDVSTLKESDVISDFMTIRESINELPLDLLLIALQNSNYSTSLAVEIGKALLKIDKEIAFKTFLILAKDKNPLLRRASAIILGELKRKEAVPILAELFLDTFSESIPATSKTVWIGNKIEDTYETEGHILYPVRDAALDALRAIGGPEVNAILDRYGK